jgi:hypothetical protein
MVLAKLADPVAGQPLDDRLHCPHCGSTVFDVIKGDRVGSAMVASVRHERCAALDDADLAEAVRAALIGD